MNDGALSSGGTAAEELAWRELEVLELLDQHLTNREIADRLHLAAGLHLICGQPARAERAPFRRIQASGIGQPRAV